jgi:hypothetical protein
MAKAFFFRLTIAGTYRLAIRRNLGHVGQLAVAKILDVSVGRFAVGRSERLLAKAFNLLSQAWYQERYQALDEYLQNMSKARVVHLILQ